MEITNRIERNIGYLCLIILFSAGIFKPCETAAQNREYWFVAPCPSPQWHIPVFFMITNMANVPADVTMRFYNGGSPQDSTYTIPAGGYWKYDLTTAAAAAQVENPFSQAGNVTKYGVHITSTQQISAYYMIASTDSRDIFTLKGAQALGREFYVPMQSDNASSTGGYTNAYDQIDIVATEDDTEVIVNPTGIIRVNGASWAAGTILKDTLDRGETLKIVEYTANQTPTLSGTHITADKDIAVTIIEDLVAGDTSGDQIVPVTSLGTTYVVPKGYRTTANSDRFYVVATQSGTNVTVNGTTFASNMSAGATQRYTFATADVAATVQANYPIYVYQRTGYNEEGAAILPSIYALNQKSVTFWATNATNHKLFIVYRTGTQSDFTVKYGNGTASPLDVGTPITVPSITGWSLAKFDLTASTVNDKVVTIANPNSVFSLGYIAANPGAQTMTCYGNFSTFFNSLHFAEDTIWCCKGGANPTLDGGYAANYTWTLPDGTISPVHTSTLEATQRGLYYLTVDYDPGSSTDSIWVFERIYDYRITRSGGNGVGAGTYTYGVDLNGESAIGVSYVWRVDGVQVSTAATYTATWDNDDEKFITVDVTDAVVGCTTTFTAVHHRLPDNISDAECYVLPPAKAWGMREAEIQGYDQAEHYMYAHSEILAGDMDGDGTAEIITGSTQVKPVSTLNAVNFYNSDGQFIRRINTATVTPLSGKYGVARVKRTATSDTTLLVVAASNGYLYAYDYFGNQLWQSDNLYAAAATLAPVGMGFADFNLDGWAEIYINNRIFDAATGKLLADGGSTNNRGQGIVFSNYNGYRTVAADITGDSRLELVAGNQVYSVDITDRNGTAGNSIQPVITLPSFKMEDGTTVAPADGPTHLADMDGDGHPDAVVMNIDNTNGISYIYVWSPYKNAVLACKTLTEVRAQGIAMLGDIDGDGRPEIVFNTVDKPDNASAVPLTRAFRYVDSNPILQPAWPQPLSTYDRSGFTGMTLFDFNQDGISEIVYRDNSHLRIINGSGKSHITGEDTIVYNLAEYLCSANTAGEYPIVAGLGGKTKIVISRSVSGEEAALKIYEADGADWAPARKVWNQYAYFSVHVNDDLTIPTGQINPAAVFPGAGGGVQPYNAFLQQQTILGQNGLPFWPAPRPTVDSTFYFYDAVKDTMFVTVDAGNVGDAPFSAPFHITVYKNTLGNAVKYTYPYPLAVPHDDTTRITFGIPNYLAGWGDAATLRIRLNDAGDTFSDQAVCDSATRDASDGPALLAVNDAYNTFVNNSIAFNPRVNDSIPPQAFTFDVGMPKRGTRPTPQSSSDSVQYTPPPNGAGIDTIYYALSQQDGKFTSTAVIYVYIANPPDNISGADCYIPAPGTIWDIERKAVSDVAVHFLATPFVGDLDGDPDGRLEVVAPDNGANDGDLSTAMLIFNDSLRLIRTITLATPVQNDNTMAFLIADIDGDGKGEIVVAATDNKLYCYAPYGSTPNIPEWVSPAAFTPSGAPSPIIADINGDGYAEILAGNSIYDARTGVLLVTLPTGGRGISAGGPASSMPVFADMDNDGIQDVAAGNTVYKVTINSRTDASQNSAVILAQIAMPDGFTSVADIDLDGDLDAIVTGEAINTAVYAWDGATSAQIGQTILLSASLPVSRASAGDINGDSLPDIAFAYTDKVEAYSYDVVSNTFTQLWQEGTSDASGATAMSMFDFNQDGMVELVYRDMTLLRIMDGVTGDNIVTHPCVSGTQTEYPVIVDLDRDSHADILVSGTVDGYTGTRIVRYGSLTPGQWASARSVWNQHAYNAVNINEDLTVPQYPLNPATEFPGSDGLTAPPPSNDDDNVRPYNAFLQQQTVINAYSMPVWLTPDAIFDPAQTSVFRDGDSIAVHVCIANRGAAALGSPVYATLYRDDAIPANRITTDSIPGYIMPGNTACLTFGIPDVKVLPPFVQFVVRLNDRNGVYRFQAECDCDCGDSIQVRINPALDLLIHKDATLGGEQDTGRYSNPVSVLYSEKIRYEITAINANLHAGDSVVVTDTLPPYLKYAGNASGGTASFPKAGIFPERDVVRFKIDNLAPYATVRVSFDATPESGASASQPLYINSAWVQVSDTLLVMTNRTYHQGAGVSIVTFSASAGGHIFNAGEQAIDYRTSPRAGIRIVPDSGYVFAGWSYSEYVSLRGEIIPADSGIMNYDDLVIYGNVELRAGFAPLKDDPKEKEITEDRVIDTGDRIWSNGDYLYIRTKEGSTVRICTPDGVLHRHFTIAADGVTAVRLSRGIYIVTLNGDRGYKVVLL
ncbi:MAG: FG-GAP-like repeat-containing protein [Tannerella sp.]|jgi:hypothetical protein|nr:FG-GAP-like repeat-containing protein [Tannerella sp.]